MKRHTKAAPQLLRYTTTVPANATVLVEEIELSANSALAIGCKADQACTVRLTNYDLVDGVDFDSDSYAVTAGNPVTYYHRGVTGGVRIELIAGAANVIPDLRVWGMSQP